MLAEDLIPLRAPQYAGDERIPMYLQLAEELIGDQIPEETPREYAKALQVLHWLTISDRTTDGDGGVGAVTEEKEGELTIKYGNASNNLMWFTSDMKGELSQTVWGIELYALIKRYIVTVATRYA